MRKKLRKEISDMIRNEMQREKSTPKPIGEVHSTKGYTLQESYNLFHSMGMPGWIYFYYEDIQDRHKNEIRIKDRWYPEEDIIFYNNFIPYDAKKKEIEEKYEKAKKEQEEKS